MKRRSQGRPGGSVSPGSLVPDSAENDFATLWSWDLLSQAEVELGAPLGLFKNPIKTTALLPR